RHIPLFLELVLAQVAPSLKIVRVAAVLNEAGRGRVLLKEVLTDNGGNTFPVWSTANHHWFSCRHALLCGLTLKLSRIGARSQEHGKFFLPCYWRSDAISA